MPYNAEHPENSGVLYDEQGRPYTLMADGRGGYTRNYISPVAMGGQAPEDTTGLLHSRPEWNTKTAQWDTPFDWGNLLSLGVAGGLGAGVADAFMPGLFGGGAGAGAGAGGGAADAVLPATQIGNGYIGPIAGGTGLAGVDTALGAGGGGLGGEILNQVKKHTTGGGGDGFGVEDLLKLIGVGGLGVTSALQNRGPAYPPELDEMLKLQKQRMEAQNPLYDSILKLSQSRLPTSAQRGY